MINSTNEVSAEKDYDAATFLLFAEFCDRAKIDSNNRDAFNAWKALSDANINFGEISVHYLAELGKHERVIAEIGGILGDRAYTNNDGVVESSVVLANLPELIRELRDMAHANPDDALVLFSLREDNVHLRGQLARQGEVVSNALLAERDHIMKINELQQKVADASNSEIVNAADRQTEALLAIAAHLERANDIKRGELPKW